MDPHVMTLAVATLGVGWLMTQAGLAKSALELKKRAQAWRTLRYVLNNGRKHGVWLARDQPDPFSSGRWFKRWRPG